MFSDYSAETTHLREEGKIDMRFVAGDPWEPEDRRAREDAHRPCMSFDMLGQYLNQAGNTIRQNKRAVQLTPMGSGANDKNAEHRESLIRGIDFRSRAQQAHITAFDNMIERSYGFSRITTQPVRPDSFDLEIRIKRIQNPDTVIYNPDYREADGSDVTEVFVLDYLSKKDYKRKYPRTKAISFSGIYLEEAPSWIHENYIQVAELWKVHCYNRNLLLIETSDGDIEIFEDELKENLKRREPNGRFADWRKQIVVKREEQREQREVVQYVTNGVEIIDTSEWKGTRIPIPGCFGKELFMDNGGGVKRHLFSMTRLARDPAMMHAFLTSQEAEEAGMAPKSPLQGFKGQFESDAEAIEMLNKIPRSSVQFDVPTDWNPQWGPPPLPTRPQFEPNFQLYEVAKDAASRSVQASMGIAPLPDAAQRRNEKSGVALERIQTAEAIGTFHFTDNYDRYLLNCYWQINELLKPIYDTARDVPTERPDGKPGSLRINDHAYEVANPDKDHLHTDEGQFDVTLNIGPSRESERDEASDYVDMLIQNLAALQIQPQVSAKILAMATRMRNIGAFGKEIADLLDPPDPSGMSPQAQAALQQLQTQLQQLQEENAALHMDRAGRVMEQQTKKEIEAMKAQNAIVLKHLDNLTQLIKAELAAKSRSTDQIAEQDARLLEAQLGFHHDQIDRAHDAAHELAMRESAPPPVISPNQAASNGAGAEGSPA